MYRRALVVVSLALVAACGSAAPTSPASPASPTSAPTSGPVPAAGVLAPSATMAATPAAGPTQPATPGRCVSPRAANGATLPDLRCTPGVVDVQVTAADLCPHLSGSVVRLVTSATKAQVRAAYADHVRGEIDHLISLELGGSNAPANLWPEDGPIPNPKDAVENSLHHWVCAVGGAASATRLAAAQTAIRSDWTTAEGIIK